MRITITQQRSTGVVHSRNEFMALVTSLTTIGEVIESIRPAVVRRGDGEKWLDAIQDHLIAERSVLSVNAHNPVTGGSVRIGSFATLDSCAFPEIDEDLDFPDDAGELSWTLAEDESFFKCRGYYLFSGESDGMQAESGPFRHFGQMVRDGANRSLYAEQPDKKVVLIRVNDIQGVSRQQMLEHMAEHFSREHGAYQFMVKFAGLMNASNCHLNTVAQQEGLPYCITSE